MTINDVHLARIRAIDVEGQQWMGKLCLDVCDKAEATTQLTALLNERAQLERTLGYKVESIPLTKEEAITVLVSAASN